MIPNAFAFFDIGDTLATVSLSSAGDDIDQLVILPGVLPALQNLQAEEVRLGIISNRGNIEETKVKEALDRIGLLNFFEPALVIFGPKNSTETFVHAAETVGKLVEEAQNIKNLLLFVGENAAERSFARKAGFLVASHPQAALDILQNQVLGFQFADSRSRVR